MTATGRNQSLHVLTSKQIKALAVLHSGGTHEEAAAAAQTHRVTITRWANHHPAFIAELNRMQQETLAICSTELIRITADALEVIARALEHDNGDLALRWMRIALPAIQARSLPVRVGPVDSSGVVDEHRLSMPTVLEEGIHMGFQRSTLEAEDDFNERLAS